MSDDAGGRADTGWAGGGLPPVARVLAALQDEGESEGHELVSAVRALGAVHSERLATGRLVGRARRAASITRIDRWVLREFPHTTGSDRLGVVLDGLAASWVRAAHAISTEGPGALNTRCHWERVLALVEDYTALAVLLTGRGLLTPSMSTAVVTGPGTARRRGDGHR